MANIDLFDKYIKGELSETERKEFNAQLESDQEFATDFNLYSLSVFGICKEAEQNNLDFGIAMKKLTKEQLRDVIGKPKQAPVFKPKRFTIKHWLWQAASIAAVVAIAIGFVFYKQDQYRTQYQNELCDNVYACARFEDSNTRGPAYFSDITKLDDAQLEARLPEMEQNYSDSDDLSEVYLAGYPLAMAYIRLHKRQQALDILSDMVSKLEQNEDYEPELRELRMIISILN